jgi:hypothetical protein
MGIDGKYHRSSVSFAVAFRFWSNEGLFCERGGWGGGRVLEGKPIVVPLSFRIKEYNGSESSWPKITLYNTMFNVMIAVVYSECFIRMRHPNSNIDVEHASKRHDF